MKMRIALVALLLCAPLLASARAAMKTAPQNGVPKSEIGRAHV